MSKLSPFQKTKIMMCVVLCLSIVLVAIGFEIHGDVQENKSILKELKPLIEDIKKDIKDNLM